MARSVPKRRPLLVLALVAAATVLAGTGSAQAAMIAGGGTDAAIALGPDRAVGGVGRAAYLTLSLATAVELTTAIQAATTDDPPFLCQMVPPTDDD